MLVSAILGLEMEDILYNCYTTKNTEMQYACKVGISSMYAELLVLIVLACYNLVWTQTVAKKN